MTERGLADPFETRLADRVRAYSDPAAARRIDALEVSRTAMAAGHGSVWSNGRLRAWRGLRIARLGWAAAMVVVVLVGAAVLVAERRPPEAVGGPIPGVLRHVWQRPSPVAPGPDLYGSGFLSLIGGQAEFGREPGPEASRSAISAAGSETLLATATVDTIGCAPGDAGAYRWSVDGHGTVMTLTAVGTDRCAAREDALAGPWVRADLPPPQDGDPTLPPGTHLTSQFNPFGDAALPGRLSYTVPAGWKVKGDEAGSLGLHHVGGAAQGQTSTNSFVMIFARSRVAAAGPDGATCGPLTGDTGVGTGIDDIVAAIIARPGVVSTPPVAVTIGGYPGTMLDLQLAPSWTGYCVGLGGPVVGVPILVGAGNETGPGLGLGPDQPLRLILLKLTDERTMAIGFSDVGPSPPSSLDRTSADVLPILESFVFHP